MQIANTTNNYNTSFQKLYIKNPERMGGSLAAVCANQPELNRLAGKLEKFGKDLVLDVVKDSHDMRVVGSARNFGEKECKATTTLVKSYNSYDTKRLADKLQKFMCTEDHLYYLGVGRPEERYAVNNWCNWYKMS